MSQARELAIGIVERIRANMKRHPHDVDAQTPIKIEMTRNDPKESGKPSDRHRLHFEFLERFS